MLKLIIVFATFCSAQAFSCNDVSGAYVHLWEESDFREGYCLDIVQTDCQNARVSVAGVRYKNGKVYANNKEIFPDWTANVSIVENWTKKYTGNAWFERKPNVTCQKLNY